MRITWDKALEKRLDWDIPGYPCDSLGSAQTRRYPYLSQHIPSYTELYHRGISRDIPVQESYPCISQNNVSIPTYTGISRDKSHWVILGYPSISRDMAGCRFSRCSAAATPRPSLPGLQPGNTQAETQRTGSIPASPAGTLAQSQPGLHGVFAIQDQFSSIGTF